MTSSGDTEVPRVRVRRVAAIVLAAGRSQRMQPVNKLLVDVAGTPLVARVVARVLAAGVDHVVVVTGHEAEEVGAALASSGVTFVHNPQFAEGLSSSLRRGLRALSVDFEGAMVCLADMPRVDREHVQALLSAFDREDGARICVPTAAGRRGNPVVWPARYFEELAAIVGDTGGRALLETHADAICYVPMPDDAVLFDVDTKTDLEELGTRRLST